MRVGLLGAGRIGNVHAQAISAHPASELVAVCDVSDHNAQSLAAIYGCAVRSSEEIIADSAIDAVLIATSTDTHSDLIEAAAAAGKAVLCEKPVDLSLVRASACLSALGDKAAQIMIGFNRRFDPGFGALKTAIDAGEIGKTELLSITSFDPAPPPIDYVKVSGGMFRDMMIHDFDMARFLLGEEPVQVFATGAALVDPAIGDAGDVDTAAVLLTTASGRICQISNSRRATYGYDQRVEVHGSNGMLRAGNVLENTVESAGEAGFTQAPAQHFFLERYEAAYRAEMAHFIASVAAGTTPLPGIIDGLRAQMLADAAARSLETGAPMTLEDQGR